MAGVLLPFTRVNLKKEHTSEGKLPKCSFEQAES